MNDPVLYHGRKPESRTENLRVWLINLFGVSPRPNALEEGDDAPDPLGWLLVG